MYVGPGDKRGISDNWYLPHVWLAWPALRLTGLAGLCLAGLSLADPGHNQVQLGWLASVWLAWPGRGRLFLACAWPAWAKPWGALGGPSDAENSM